MTSSPADPPPSTAVGTQTVEAVVRRQLGRALGGGRGMAETAVPTIAFLIVFLRMHQIGPALWASLGCAGVLLAIRLVQRSSPQFVLNSLAGIGVGALFAWNAARGGGDAADQALAYFLPGILYNAGYAVVMALSVLVRWPLLGFVVGSATGDPTAWRREPAVVRLCTRLTWLLIIPCVLRVAGQLPVYLAGRNGWWDEDSAIAVLGTLKLLMGWPLQVAALAAMAWVLTRGHTPYQAPVAASAAAPLDEDDHQSDPEPDRG